MRSMLKNLWVLLYCFSPFFLNANVKVGADLLFTHGTPSFLQGKRIGLITNQSAMNCAFKTTFHLIKEHAKNYQLVALFAPEHGFYGDAYADEKIEDQEIEGIPIYSLHGNHKRPTETMLSAIDVLIYDIQDIGSRSYTFLATLCYCMEAAAKQGILMVVLDRPNPMGGLVVDGPLVLEAWRSFFGYMNVPYCHGMTIGELAHFFNSEYKIGCHLIVIPMKGWQRGQTFAQTGLPWVPTSPQIPESDTPYYYPTTGLIGHCSIASIGIGYPLPFKLVGAPWVQAEKFASEMNKQALPGVYFQPYYFRPFYGKFEKENCQGVRIIITDPNCYLPFTTQCTIMGVIKNLYPTQFYKALNEMIASPSKREVFNKLIGSDLVLTILCEESYIIWKLREVCLKARQDFIPIRARYLNPAYH
ncbi:MAG: DUF1343 domain-containing protein [Chlamydiales bacterium]